METPQQINESHLAAIQSNINRLATNSFLIKGWSVTLVSAIFVLSAKNVNTSFVLTAYFPSIMFWLLDGYFLGMERRFVEMYNQAAQGLVFQYEIKPGNFTSKRACMLAACLSRTIILFHGTIFITIFITMLVN